MNRFYSSNQIYNKCLSYGSDMRRSADDIYFNISDEFPGLLDKICNRCETAGFLPKKSNGYVYIKHVDDFSCLLDIIDTTPHDFSDGSDDPVIAYSTKQFFGSFSWGGAIDWRTFFNCSRDTDSLLERTLHKSIFLKRLTFVDAFHGDDEVLVVRKQGSILANENYDIWHREMEYLREILGYIQDDCLAQYAGAWDEGIRDKEKLDGQYNYTSALTGSGNLESLLKFRSTKIRDELLRHDCKMINILMRTLSKNDIHTMYMELSPYFEGWVPFARRDAVFEDIYLKETQSCVRLAYIMDGNSVLGDMSASSDVELVDLKNIANRLESVCDRYDVTKANCHLMLLAISHYRRLMERAKKENIKIPKSDDFNTISNYFEDLKKIIRTDSKERLTSSVNQRSFAGYCEDDAFIYTHDFVWCADRLCQYFHRLIYNIENGKLYHDNDCNSCDGWYDDDGNYYPDWLGGTMTEAAFWENEV